jgi:hypothetical protein
VSIVKADLRPAREKTLDELEGVTWGPPTFSSNLVRTCHRLRTKPVGEYDTEDLRVMIGQNIGLPWLLPLAVDWLEEDPWVSGHLYPGDLLAVAAKSKFDWATRADLRDRLRAVIERALAAMSAAAGAGETHLPDPELPVGKAAATFAAELRTALERLD